MRNKLPNKRHWLKLHVEMQYKESIYSEVISFWEKPDWIGLGFPGWSAVLQQNLPLKQELIQFFAKLIIFYTRML